MTPPNTKSQVKPMITAFAQSPDRGQGLARDMIVRWALEEAAQAYDVRLMSFTELKEPAHRKLQPFGQIPTYQAGDLELFESASIVLQIAETHAGLMPLSANKRSRMITWMFSAVSTMEPPIVEFGMATLFEKDKPWYQERRELLESRVKTRLGDLSKALGEREWLEEEFNAGDLVMIAVLRRLRNSGLLNELPNIAAFVARGEARPAFKRAFVAQLAVFEGSGGS